MKNIERIKKKIEKMGHKIVSEVKEEGDTITISPKFDGSEGEKEVLNHIIATFWFQYNVCFG